MKLLLSQQFKEELRREFAFLAESNPAAARTVCRRVVKAVLRLKQFPDSGRAWRLANCRELIIAGLPYIVIYTVEADTVIVAALFHTSREVPHVH